MKLFKIYIIFIIFICFKCRTESYYSECEYDYVSEEKKSVSVCNFYNPVDPDNTTPNKPNHYCCYFTYKIPYAEYYYYYYKVNEHNKTNEDNKRKLGYLYNDYESCIGISQEGYDKIKKVIFEIENEKKYHMVTIDCLSKYLKLFIIMLIPTFLLF